MRTARSSKWLLSLLPLVMVLLVVRGQAATDAPIVAAAKSGDLATVKALITKRVNVNEAGTDGSTALLWAAYHSDLEMTRALLAAGAAANTANRYGLTPLLQASRNGATPVLQALVRAGADPKRAHLEGETSLMAASRTGRLENVKLLLEAGADVNGTDAYQQQTALMWAAAEGHTEVVKILLARGADASVKDTFYKATAMTWALDGKHFEIVKLLLPKVPEDAGDVLSTGVSESNQELVQAALATGKVSAEDMTVAMAGAMDDPKNAAIVEALKKAGAVPPPTVDAAVLQSYAGRYRGDPGPEVTFSVKDGKLIVSSSGQPPTPLMPLNQTTFRPVAFSGISFAFNSENGKIVSVAFKQGQNTTALKRIEETKQP